MKKEGPETKKEDDGESKERSFGRGEKWPLVRRRRVRKERRERKETAGKSTFYLLACVSLLLLRFGNAFLSGGKPREKG